MNNVIYLDTIVCDSSGADEPSLLLEHGSEVAVCKFCNF